MDSFRESFSQPLPAWISEIRDEGRAKIVSASFASACRQGNSAVIRALIIGLWPFVDEFPKSIIRLAAGFSGVRLLKDRQLLNTLLHRGPQILSGIRNDEENHRKLWLETGNALGLNFPFDFEMSVLPETQSWINAINAQADPFTQFLRFAAIEMIAEAVSVDFLASKTFTSLLGERGCKWFRVHAVHEPGMTHEELEVRLAFASFRGEPSKDNVSSVIQPVVDLFVDAAEACARSAYVNLINPLSTSSPHFPGRRSAITKRLRK